MRVRGGALSQSRHHGQGLGIPQNSRARLECEGRSIIGLMTGAALTRALINLYPTIKEMCGLFRKVTTSMGANDG